MRYIIIIFIISTIIISAENKQAIIDKTAKTDKQKNRKLIAQLKAELSNEIKKTNELYLTLATKDTEIENLEHKIFNKTDELIDLQKKYERLKAKARIEAEGD